jgi:hypothetical protein
LSAQTFIERIPSDEIQQSSREHTAGYAVMERAVSEDSIIMLLTPEQYQEYKNELCKLPNRRFRQDLTASEVIAYAREHKYVWYQAPMDYDTKRLYLTTAVKLWKRSPERFAFSVHCYDWNGEYRLRFDETHLDRFRVPNPQWFHGMFATVNHACNLDNGYTADVPGREILKRGMHTYSSPFEKVFPAVQWSGLRYVTSANHLNMDSLSHALNHSKRQNIGLAACKFIGGKKYFRILYKARPMRPEEK